MIKREELANPDMSKAHDDEMTFVLLARDEAAPETIRFWTDERVRRCKNRRDDPQIIEALECAKWMEGKRNVEAVPTSRNSASDAIRLTLKVCEDLENSLVKNHFPIHPADIALMVKRKIIAAAKAAGIEVKE